MNSDIETSQFVKSPEWLIANIDNPNIRIVAASWFLPAQKRSAEAEYKAGHIPGAIFFDQDSIVDKQSTLPHALPTPQYFAERVGQLGISEDHTIVVYDALGMFTAPRIWWMFKIMGAKRVFVLDGGFDNWQAEGLAITDQINKFPATQFNVDFDDSSVAHINDVLAATSDGNIELLDARSAGRFTGEEAEPRAGMRSGHMPSAKNTPVFSFSENGKLKPLNELRDIFESKSVDLNKKIITTCGSGVTAAVITLALNSIGKTDIQLYDGSWSEWGARKDTPVQTGD